VERDSQPQVARRDALEGHRNIRPGCRPDTGTAFLPASCFFRDFSDFRWHRAGMDQAYLGKVIDTFFTCRAEEITGIFREFLAAMEAEQTLPPVQVMSQNYETAQANPEIHVLPGNLKDARDAVFPYFWGTDGWSSPLHLENVKGPANYASLIGALACLLKNPNLCTDTYSQRSNELEVKAVTALANLLFYHTEDPWGVFTMGGTVSNLYGAKIGLEKVVPGAMHRGLQGHRVVGVVSEAAHYSNRTIAGWMGLGTENLIAIPVDRALSMRLDLLTAKLRELYAAGVRVAFITATFGTTDAFGVDDIAAIRRIVDEESASASQPAPQLHVDAAVGWVVSFLTEYRLDENPLELKSTLLPLVRQVQKQSEGLRVADSITIDFHKMGWGHYPGSAFLVNRRSDLKYLSRSVEEMPYFAEADARRDPALFTLECSRPALGPYTVMASLNGLGLTGWQMLVARALQLARLLKERLERLEYCKVLNLETSGPSVVWWVQPKGRNAKEIFARVEAGELPAGKLAHYGGEIRRLFDKREKDMDPAVDARLSFTTSIGYHPHGLDLPAWKAVFFHPKTDEAVIDRLLYSIEELL
jgi:L-2,4-diaminobutyrate decarboxylase